MNLSGESSPSCGWRQRISASTPVTPLLPKAMRGW
jgi:hypothetical protein